MDLPSLERAILREVSARAVAADPAHDLLHVRRVVATTRRLCELEGAQAEVAVPAAWLHDFLPIPKNDPRRSQASRLSSEAAADLLRSLGYARSDLAAVTHAIEAHSFSAGIAPLTVEAAVVQDADRLDALGAIGIARCFATAGTLGRAFYCENDPFCESRPPEDGAFTLDHFFAKLLPIAESLRTTTGLREGKRRLAIVRTFLDELKVEIGPHNMPSLP